MIVAGLSKCSFVDYPGKLSAVVFTPGCNFDCFYCHNRSLLSGCATAAAETDARGVADVLEFLRGRRGLLDAVTVTGGEPTCQQGLSAFCGELRRMGFAVKLDSNGTHPRLLQELIDGGLVDYVAMDVKAPLDRYEEIVRRPVDLAAVERSIDLLLAGGVEYEFRTTFAPPLWGFDVAAIARRIRGARRYALQQYRPVESLPIEQQPRPHEGEYLRQCVRLAEPYVRQCLVRGLSAERRDTATTATPSLPARAG